MNLSTRVCEILEIEKPIVLAGMGGASCPALAAAVSNAGGLGVLGAAGCGPSMLREWIRETRELTDKPFGVDTLLPASVRRANYDDLDNLLISLMIITLVVPLTTIYLIQKTKFRSNE